MTTQSVRLSSEEVIEQLIAQAIASIVDFPQRSTTIEEEDLKTRDWSFLFWLPKSPQIKRGVKLHIYQNGGYFYTSVEAYAGSIAIKEFPYRWVGQPDYCRIDLTHYLQWKHYEDPPFREEDVVQLHNRLRQAWETANKEASRIFTQIYTEHNYSRLRGWY